MPFGRYKHVQYEEQFPEHSSAMSSWVFTAAPFEGVQASPEDFLYADPPYDESFTQYFGTEFAAADQERLADKLAQHPGPVVASNLATDRMVHLYRERGFDVRIVRAPRSISANGDRTAVGEMLATKNLGPAEHVVQQLAEPPASREACSERSSEPVGAPALLPWFGDNRHVTRTLESVLPEAYGTYHEPFLGSGCLFFHLEPKAAVLSDKSPQLIRTFTALRDHVQDVISLLKLFDDDPQFFEALCPAGALVDPASQGDVRLAATTIYLNTVCPLPPAGIAPRPDLLRVSYDGITAGERKVCDEQRLRAVSAALAGVELRCEDFSAVAARAETGDLVFIDAPIVGSCGASGRSSFAACGFSIADQTRLRDTARCLKEKGVHVVLTNSDFSLVKYLYSDGFTVTRTVTRCPGDQMESKPHYEEACVIT